MKCIILSVPAILIILNGCSITRQISFSSSKEKFYEDYNNSAATKSVRFILTNDSTIFQDDQTEIVNDTLYVFKEATEEKYYRLPASDVRKMTYLTNDYRAADLLLNNGLRLKGKNISFTKDSIWFTEIREFTRKEALVPAADIKTANYKNHWKGVIPGLLAGILAGGLIGTTGWIYHPMNGGMTEQFDQATATIQGALTGLLIGPVVGYLIGFNINYDFK